jgi:hypothetical protein
MSSPSRSSGAAPSRNSQSLEAASAGISYPDLACREFPRLLAYNIIRVINIIKLNNIIFIIFITF